MKNTALKCISTISHRSAKRRSKAFFFSKQKKGAGKTISKKEYVRSRINEWDCISDRELDVLRRFFRGLGTQIKVQISFGIEIDRSDRFPSLWYERFVEFLHGILSARGFLWRSRFNGGTAWGSTRSTDSVNVHKNTIVKGEYEILSRNELEI